MRILKSLWLATTLAVTAGLADTGTAATVTFDGLVGPDTWIEDGVRVEARGLLGWHFIEDAAHLDAGGGPFTDRLTFTTAQPFRPISFRVFGMGSIMPYDNLVVTGRRDSKTLFSDTFFAGNPGTERIYKFDVADLLDSLTIAAVLPPNAEEVCENISPCSHFSVDNVKLAPIPLPPAALLLLGGSLALLGLRWRP